MATGISQVGAALLFVGAAGCRLLGAGLPCDADEHCPFGTNCVDRAWLGFTDETVEALDDATQFRSVVDDQPIGGGFENFPNGEPNDSSGVEDCAEIFAPGGTWNDQECAALRPFVCEI